MKTVIATEPPKKRPRGRPRKVPLPLVESESEKDMDDDEEDEERFRTTLYEGENLDRDDDVTLGLSWNRLMHLADAAAYQS